MKEGKERGKEDRRERKKEESRKEGTCWNKPSLGTGGHTLPCHSSHFPLLTFTKGFIYSSFETHHHPRRGGTLVPLLDCSPQFVMTPPLLA